VEDEGDGVLTDDADMRLEGVDLVRLRFKAVLQAVVLRQQLVSHLWQSMLKKYGINYPVIFSLRNKTI